MDSPADDRNGGCGEVVIRGNSGMLRLEESCVNLVPQCHPVDGSIMP